MKRLIGLSLCLGLALVLGGCGGGDSGKPKSSPPPSSPSPPAPTPTPTPDPGEAVAPQPKAKPEVDVFDDHSDNPWYDEAAAAKSGVKLPTVWEPDKALVNQLEPYQDVEGYQIRLPKGFSLTPMPIAPSAGMKLFIWTGPKQADGSVPFMQASLRALAPEETKETKLNLTNALAGARDASKAQQRDWQETPAETGQLNGLPSLRMRNGGVAAQGGLKVRGFQYVAQDGSTLIMISGMASEANADALKLAEAAVLTFRKK